MKMEVDSAARLNEWSANPVPAVFQGQRLEALSDQISTRPLAGCVFLGCDMTPQLIEAAAKAKCIVIHPRRELEFDAFSPGLYSPDELYDKFDPKNAYTSYKLCRDFLIYDSVTREIGVDNQGKPVRVERATDVDVTLMRRIHDWSIADALDELLTDVGFDNCVAIMGGHDTPRSSPVYHNTAQLALKLAKKGFCVITGGGPGLMEAANLGAYSAGFENPDETLAAAIESLTKTPKESDRYDSPRWLEVGYTTWKAMNEPQSPKKSLNIGIPTWFYGHEPPNVFATAVAKYFENSVREEGLLAVARAGIIYADGNGGTVQEIFQDANQNYYKTYGKRKSPMVLFNTSYWNPPSVNYNNPKEKQKPAYLLLHKLATEKQFDDCLLLSDVIDDVVKFIDDRRPKA